MADSKSLADTLALYKDLQKNGGVQATATPKRNAPQMVTGSVDELDEMVFGKYVPRGDEGWSADKELEEIKNGRKPKNLDKCGVPKAILESILKNPCEVAPTDPRMDEFTNKLANISGLDNVSRINEQLEVYDQQKENSKKSMIPTLNEEVGTVDYERIRQIVDETVDAKLAAITNVLLNENITHGGNNTPKLGVMQLADKFMFLDSDNNVYECKMVYKGKNKAKKK